MCVGVVCFCLFCHKFVFVVVAIEASGGYGGGVPLCLPVLSWGKRRQT